MAKVKGGLHGELNGSIGNITYSSARTADGKVTTARQKSDPSNPQTPDQQEQRGQFALSQKATSALGSAIYTDDWDRVLGNLPGFQGMVKMFLDNAEQGPILKAPARQNLGSLAGVANLSVTAAPSSDEISLSWDSDSGDNGTANDELVAAAIEADPDDPRDPNVVRSIGQVTRSSTSHTLSVVHESADSYLVMTYLRGADSAEGLLSPAEFAEV